ncbi:hypothetical protein MNBD_DELTA01-59 [hydrothermal vent metagenome]|uniref:Uncharacterized protein n=1 Tax=hydrothermal vent metagenome TaxID=652676 RepID=A0A3B0QZ78_9ZZZZ
MPKEDYSLTVLWNTILDSINKPLCRIITRTL